MVYNVKEKILGNTELTKLEWQILEILIEYRDNPLSANKIADILCNKYYITGVNTSLTTSQSVSTIMSKLNKKFNKIIENKRQLGYRLIVDIEIIV